MRFPRGVVTIPNSLTLLRLVLTFPIFWAITHYEIVLGFMLFIVTAGTDFLDGRIARRTGHAEGIGKVLDRFADGVLFLGVIYALWHTGRMWTVWVAALILSGIIAICGQVALMKRQQRLTTYGDRLGKVCGFVTYLSLGAALLGRGTEFIFPLTLPVIYVSLFRDWYNISHLRTEHASIEHPLGVGAENDRAFWLLSKVGAGPREFLVWLVLAIAAVDVGLSLFYGTFWPRKGAMSLLQDDRALLIDFVVCPIVALFWARTPRLVSNLVDSLSTVLPTGSRTPSAPIGRLQRLAWWYLVPIFLFTFEFKFYIPAQKLTTANEFYHQFPQFLAAKAFLWVIVHYMVVMFFVNTTPAAIRVLRHIPADASLNIAAEDGFYGLSGIGIFVRDALIFLFTLGSLLVLVFYTQYRESRLLNTAYSLGLNFLSLWILPFLLFYGVLLYRTYNLMAAFKGKLLSSINKSVADDVAVLRTIPNMRSVAALARASVAHSRAKDLPVLPIPNMSLIVLYGLNASFWSSRVTDLWKLLFRVMTTGH